ncbi:MAG: ATP-binding protein [Segetibacter sp.]
MSELEFNTDNTKIGFRLHSVELLNWGTFHNKIWKIEPNGSNSLLTGDVGSGKSTLVDAITCLIVPHNKITFNKAAGAENKERTLISYIKGEYKNTKSEEADSREKAVSLRYNNSADSTFSVIIANFSNDGYRESVSLAQVFWIENDKAQKLLIIREKSPLSIKEHFSQIEDARELRRRLKELSNTELFDDNFSKYSQRFRYLFGMQTDKAIDLFYQTVSMKSVSSLTLFVREQMLERTEIKAQIEDLKKRFDDLNKAYAAVQEARKQRDTLAPLVEFCENFRKFEERIQDIDNILQSIPAYFALKKITLLEAEIADSERQLLQIAGQLEAIEDLLNTKRDSQNQLRQDIRNNGGARLEQITLDIQQKEKSRDSKREKHKEYAELTTFCGLETANTDKTFFRNLKNAELKIEELKTRQEAILKEHGKLAGKKNTIEESIESESKELESLKQRENQIPLEFLNIRDQLADALEINEEEIPFAGELLKVNEHEKDWEGALERLLRGLGVSMLVPEKHYNQISHYINARRLMDNRNRGMRFEYFKVPYSNKPNKFINDIDADSAVNKIDVKADTPFENWLESELQKRFNLRCVSIEEFQRMPGDVITKEGQYKVGNQRHIKDDRRDLWDRRNFVLGWTNEEKIRAVEKHLNELKIEKGEIENKLKDLSTEIKNNTLFQSKLTQIISYKNWLELNWKDEVEAIISLEKERNELQNSNDVLKTLQEKFIVCNQRN